MHRNISIKWWILDESVRLPVIVGNLAADHQKLMQSDRFVVFQNVSSPLLHDPSGTCF
jgi:hypothetical protein